MRRTKILGAALAAAVAASFSASCAKPPDPIERAPIVDPPPTETPTTSFSPVPSTMRRLLKRQYVNAVRTLFGTEASEAASPPDDASIDGFDAIAARTIAVSDSAVAEYEQSARAVAKAAMKNQARINMLLACKPQSSADSACFQSFAKNLGRLAFRRPLTDAEISRYAELGQGVGASFGDFSAGVEATISAMLQSPRFLYMQEVGEPTQPDDTSTRLLTDSELLTRMSFFLLDTTPDQTLLDLVDAVGLRDEEQIRYVASVMLERLEAHAALGAFYEELYRLRELDDIGKDAALYPSFTPSLASSMREETRKVIEDVVWTRDADVRELFTADYTFINKDLAALYGVDAPSGDAFGKATLPHDQGRSGILGHAGVLSRFAHSAQTSPTLRGKFVREKLLCQAIPPPPPDVVAQLPPDDPSQGPQTMKQKLSQHQKDPVCASCHTLMDGVGFAFERFDAIGAHRTTEQGLTIDTTTETEGLGAFSSPAELGAILRDNDDAAMCVVRNVYRSALGHIETKGEEEEIQAIAAEFAAKGYRVKELLTDLVASPAFRIVGVPQ